MYADFPWIAIIFVAIGLFNFFLKANKAKTEQTEKELEEAEKYQKGTNTTPSKPFGTSPQPSYPSAPKPAPVSFEQKLEEILERRRQAQPKTSPQPKTSYEYETEVRWNKKDNQNLDATLLNQTQTEAQNKTIGYLQTEQGMSSLDAIPADYSAYDISGPAAVHPVLALLHTKNGLRQAMIASEILKPKHELF